MVRVLALLLVAVLGCLPAACGHTANSRPFGGISNPLWATLLRCENARSLCNGALARDLASPTEVLAVRAALAIGRTKRAQGEPLLVSHLHDPRPAVRAMSLYGIGLITSGREAGAIARALGDPNGAVRVAALDAADRYAAAGVLRSGEARVLLDAVAVRLMRDGDSVVRARAAATLVSFGSAPNAATAVGSLVRAVEHDRDARVREFAMWSLFRGYAKAAPHAFEIASLHDLDEIVRIEAVRAIGKRGNVADVPLVSPLLHDASWRVQEQASETLRLLRGLQLTQHWTAIPSWVHVPPHVADALQSLPALPRPPVSRRALRPTPARAIPGPALDPTTAQAMSEPAPGLHPCVRIVTTKGNIYVTLFAEWAPLTVENFLNLANRGYYDNNRWFRIVPDFVVQTGDPHDNGNGDAGYAIGAEENPIVQDSYVISMGMNYTNGPNAHAIRDSAGTQYYITLSPQLHLDRDFTVFGRVTSGFDVLGRLVESDRVLRVERIADQNL